MRRAGKKQELRSGVGARRRWLGCALVLLTLSLPSVTVDAAAAVRTNAAAAVLTPSPSGSAYVPVAPIHLAPATGANPVELRAGGTRNFKIAGVGGVPADGVRAVVVNLHASRASKPTSLTVAPSGSAVPATANLSVLPLMAADNLAIVAVGADGMVTVRNGDGSVTVGLDLVGWFPINSDLTMVSPTRLADTRNGSAPDTPVRSGLPLDIAVAGRAGVPVAGVGMAVVNVTALDATTLTSVALGASGAPTPTVSNLDVLPLVPAVSLAIVPVGGNGKISISNKYGRVNVVVDVLGWLPVSAAALRLVTPTTLVDTLRDPTQGGLGADRGLDVQVAGLAGVPTSGVAAVILSVSGALATRSTALTIAPSGFTPPVASNVDVPLLLPAENLVVVPLGADGKVRITNAGGRVQVRVTVHGWFASQQVAPPTDGAWIFSPDTVMLTALGDSTIVQLVHLDAAGQPSGAAPPSGITVTPSQGAGSFDLVEIAAGRYRLTATDQVGYAEFGAVVPGISSPARLQATNLRLRAGVAVIASDRIVVPSLDGSADIRGPFTEAEVESRVSAPASDGDPFDDDIRLPVVLVGSAPAPGTLVISADGLTFAGRVVEPAGLPTLTRSGHSLISVAVVPPFDIFDDVSVTTSAVSVGGSDLSSLREGIGSTQRLTAGSVERSPFVGALATPECETEAGSKAVELTLGGTRFDVALSFGAGGNREAGNAFVDVGLEGDITVGFQLTLQLAEEIALECTVRELPILELVPPGVGAVLTGFIEPSLTFEADIKGTVGPRLTIGFTCTQHIGYKEEVTYDSTLGLHHRPTNSTTPATCQPTFSATADAAAVTIEANAGFFANADIGVRVGGAFAAWADRAGVAEGLGRIKLLNIKAGPRLHGVWENQAKVLDSEDTESSLGLEVLVEGAIDLEVPGQPAGAGVFDRLAQWISGDPNAQAEIKFLELTFPVASLYRPPTPRPGGLEISVNGDLREADDVIEVKPGDRVEVRAGVGRKGDLVPLLGDPAVTVGSAHYSLGPTSVPFDALALSVLDQGGGSAQLQGTLNVLPALCDELGGGTRTIQLLADSPMLGVLPTSGFAGKFSIMCTGPRLEFDRESVNFLANEVGFPATVGLTGFDLDGWDWSLAGVQSWMNAEPATGAFDSDEERDAIVLTINCSAVNPPAVVSHTVVATATKAGEDSKQAFLPVSADCRRQSEVDVSGQVVLETWEPGGLLNDPNRCITVQFLEFPAIEGATQYTAVVLNQVLNANQTFQAFPPWSADSYTLSVGPTRVHTFVAPAGSHRMVLGSESSGQGCNSSPRFTLVSLKAKIG